MTSIVFNGRTYTPEVLATLSLEELDILYNKLRDMNGDGGETSEFPDEQIAQGETWAALVQYLGPIQDTPHPPKQRGAAPEETSPPLSPPGPQTLPPAKPGTVPGTVSLALSLALTPAAPLRRAKLFKFPLDAEIHPPKAGTLRATVIDELRGGATYERVIEVVREFDARRGVAEKNVERRAYEVVRLVHFYCGYGMRQEGDKIFLVEA